MRRRRTQVEDLKMDLTPLIDCVFLLILFFLLTTEITVQLEDVELPVALEGEEEEPDPNNAPMIINVVVNADEDAKDPRSGKIVFNGNTLDEKQLTKELQKEAAYDAADPPHGRGNGTEADGLSKLSIIVRADKRVASKNLRTIFTACAKAKIYKLKVSTVTPE